jgi:hypothetical protein
MISGMRETEHYLQNNPDPCQLGVKVVENSQIFTVVDCAVKENGPDYSMMRKGTPNSHLLTAEGGSPFNNIRILCGVISVTCRIPEEGLG